MTPQAILARLRRLRLRLPQEWWRRAALAVLAIALPLQLADWVFPPPLKRAYETSAVVTDRRGAVLRIFPVDDGKWRIAASIDAIDPAFIRALLAYEDKRFRSHSGVDITALARAASSSMSAGRIVSGGSTITMQTARLLEPRPRNVGSKIVESFRAWQLESRFTKDEILELYLTLAPYGGNLEGVRAASWAYFGREPDRLSPDQIALLVALPQSPEARRPDLRPEAAIVARARVLDRLAAANVFAADLAAESSEYPAPVRGAFRAMAWHAADEARRLAASDRRHRGDIATTLDIALQTQLEHLATSVSDAANDQAQTAIMVVDVRTREVRASVGSASRSGAGGWIDLTNRPRSPGSTLKPFIYGLAFDDGVASAATRIADAPKRFASYRPENFDRMFRGDVTVAEALQHSLNVPAVSALDAIGARRFAATLSQAGARISMPADGDDDAGLAIALGGIGITVRDLAVLYTALGDEGRARPLVWLKPDEAAPDAKPAAGPQIMSPASAREIVRVLGESPAPKGRMPARLTQEAPVIAFKTGTSYGYRDAWAAGVGAGHAVVVWTGRADGAPRTGATGRDAALPVLFDVFDAVLRTLPTRGSGPALRDADTPRTRPPEPMARFERDNAPPHIIFPPNNAEVWSDAEHQSFVLAAQGRGRLTWYVDGAPLQKDSTGQSVWRPREPGFYSLTVVDGAGQSARTRVRVVNPDSNADASR